jgi:Uma2 family endonuclease
MSAHLRRTMTRDEFLIWAESQEKRYEFDGFEPVAMTGGTNNHGLITRNLHGILYNRLRGRPCQSMSSEGGGVATVGDRRYILIDHTKISVTDYFRSAEGAWEGGPPLGEGSVLELPEIGIVIPVDELYERVSFVD